MRFTWHMSAVDHWPLFGLRVRSPSVELRYPSDDDIAEIARRVVEDGVHDPAFMPFKFEWTDVEPPLLQQRTMQHHWGLRANWKPEEWSCNFAVVVDGRIVGSQAVGASQFATLREALTGSFLFLPEQGHGIGTEMRSTVLHFLFEGLGAEYARTAAFTDNARSLGVTARLGYEYQGIRRVISRGSPRELAGYRLPRAAWERQRRDDITIEGLEACRHMFG